MSESGKAQSDALMAKMVKDANMVAIRYHVPLADEVPGSVWHVPKDKAEARVRAGEAEYVVEAK
jgi:hypothetical protein